MEVGIHYRCDGITFLCTKVIQHGMAAFTGIVIAHAKKEPPNIKFAEWPIGSIHNSLCTNGKWERVSIKYDRRTEVTNPKVKDVVSLNGVKVIITAVKNYASFTGLVICNRIAIDNSIHRYKVGESYPFDISDNGCCNILIEVRRDYRKRGSHGNI